MGLMTALALAIHNFPEGFATFMSGLYSPELAIPVAVAIAIHNIPEGIAVSVPIYYATGSRRRAFILSFASGLSEPVGALVGYIVLRQVMNDTIFGMTFAGIAGVMVYISLNELLPSAEKFGQHHHAIVGLISGMAVMALSLLLL
ncbi:ZIP family metal transporter [Trueperella bernardiae]|uniref:ZIP family metal transporter n=3 Tax=Trueperella bernardiae TaxID=59561 RepID=A0AAW6ZJ48_9ACTO|nr:ZIP family metal transporter [Trueperella bernardiae]